ncbi:Trm112 family protein [Acidithiobacillus ferrivorans]|uniref:Trm112 family protein n=1 Tax=Acidithiobacillus ferrivorans TaxID=160808 RepID=UPI001D01A438|nr:Trm112 family protein [Acidithiobacillus ferrivorans]
MSIDHRLLDLLACPQCKGSLQPCAQRQALCCPRCQLQYPIRDDIPVLLIDEAKPYEDKSA